MNNQQREKADFLISLHKNGLRNGIGSDFLPTAITQSVMTPIYFFSHPTPTKTMPNHVQKWSIIGGVSFIHITLPKTFGERALHAASL